MKNTWKSFNNYYSNYNDYERTGARNTLFKACSFQQDQDNQSRHSESTDQATSFGPFWHCLSTIHVCLSRALQRGNYTMHTSIGRNNL